MVMSNFPRRSIFGQQRSTQSRVKRSTTHPGEPVAGQPMNGPANSQVRRALHAASPRNDGSLLQRILKAPLPVSTRGDQFERRAEQREQGHIRGSGTPVGVSRLTSRPGQALPDGLRSTLESKLGAPLEDVRVHKDRESVAAAGALGAEAFTHGRDVFLGASAQLSDTSLLAHEAAHALDNVDAIQRREATWLERRAWLGFFDHYLPRKFLNNYMDDTGNAITLTKQEMEDCNPVGVNIRRSVAFQQALTRLQAAGGGSEAISCTSLAGALTNGTLGNFTVRYDGMIHVAPDGDWVFVGTIVFLDFWDFNTGGANRPVMAEVKVQVANALLPGSPFSIDSVPVAAVQTQSDSQIQWDAAAPAHVPDNLLRGGADIAVGGDVGAGGDVASPVVGGAGGDVGAETGAQTNADF